MDTNEVKEAIERIIARAHRQLVRSRRALREGRLSESLLCLHALSVEARVNEEEVAAAQAAERRAMFKDTL